MYISIYTHDICIYVCIYTYMYTADRGEEESGGPAVLHVPEAAAKLICIYIYI